VSDRVDDQERRDGRPVNENPAQPAKLKRGLDRGSEVFSKETFNMPKLDAKCKRRAAPLQKGADHGRNIRNLAA
jgi:hypothetical protein